MQIAGLVITLNFIFMIVISPSIADKDDLKDNYDTFEANTDEIGEIDSNALATHYTTNWRAKLLDILLYYLLDGYEEEPVPVTPYVYDCQQNSPVNPQWTTTTPNVFWTHILCGQITTNNAAQGFHSKTATSNWEQCVKAPSCYPQTNGNELCGAGTVQILNFNTGNWITKQDTTTLFNPSMSQTALINHLLDIYNACRPTSGTSYFCAVGCNYRGNSIQFDIYIVLAVGGSHNGGIITAYPVWDNSCAVGYQCSNQCNNL